MRFVSDGPSIPDRLLEEHERGNVVFFCGAGVSQPALPGFGELAKLLMRKLGTPPSAESYKRMNPDSGSQGKIPLDVVFSFLQQEYGSREIEAVVADVFQERLVTNTEQHAVILRLSLNPAGVPRVVTTNFDWLFERAYDSLERQAPASARAARRSPLHVGPHLPDLAKGPPLEGIVYLHGRLPDREHDGRDVPLVLSSADFGRAYLAEGWAAQFARDLLERYVVVLVGYSATDPLVVYLLQGLRSMRRDPTGRIFAFTVTSAGDAHRWAGLGVRALAYEQTDGHRALWSSLSCWAQRAEDVETWRRSVCDLAQRGPRKLEPYQRGQVTSLVRTAVGARCFAEAELPPPAEWLCVFDRSIRRGKPRVPLIEGEAFDPVQRFGIDDDPPNGVRAAEPQSEILGPLSLLPGDMLPESSISLSGGNPESALFSPRLRHLARWITRVLYEPAVVWWAAGSDRLLEGLYDQIEWRHRREGERHGSVEHSAWELLLERFSSSAMPNGPYSPYSGNQAIQWHFFEQRIRNEGWTRSALREFERVTEPHLISKRPEFGWLPSREAGQDALSMGELVTFEVVFPKLNVAEPSIPSDRLHDVFRAAIRGLERGASLLTDIGGRTHTITFHREEKTGDPIDRDVDRYLHAVRRLFDALVESNTGAAALEAKRWPRGYAFFDKLSIYAWMSAKLFSGQDVGSGLLGLTDAAFWNGDHLRELLHTLRSRWSDLPHEFQVSIEERIFRGRPPADGEADAEAERRERDLEAATMLGWLEQQACGISATTLDRLPKLRSADSRWTPDWDRSADSSSDSREGVVDVADDPTSLLALPVGDIIRVAREQTRRLHGGFTDHKPFEGLVKRQPVRALRALTLEARCQRFPLEFWRVGVRTLSGERSTRLRLVLAWRLVGLPTSILLQLHDLVPRWFERYLPSLMGSAPAIALRLWDAVFCHFARAAWEDAEASRSWRGGAWVVAEERARSRRTVEYADNSPIGVLTETLLSMLDTTLSTTEPGMPDEFLTRLGMLFELPGEGADHAISITTDRLHALHKRAPDWVKLTVVAWFAPKHPRAEPAWSGYLRRSGRAPIDLTIFLLLKPNFLATFASSSGWEWETSFGALSARQLVRACIDLPSDRLEWLLTFDEARGALQMAGDHGRVQAAEELSRFVTVSDGWRRFVGPFVRNAWPRELACRSEGVTRGFVGMAWNSGDAFPDVVDVLVLRLDAPRDLYLPGATDDSKHIPLASTFPTPMLTFLDKLVPDEVRSAPHGLAETLEAIAGAEPSLRQDRRWKRLRQLTQQ